ncbi:MAG: glycine oxidase ThiO [Planctomycetaceae bacterium]|nr:glycine oxidase ThiO [Planctomycetaceae bacterium]
MNFDVLIVGGGAIGLSLAYELVGRGAKVHVIDRGQFGQESSWAGAGMIPAARNVAGLHPLDQLAALGWQLHPIWAERLRAETGIDNGYRRCGGLFLAHSPAGAEELASFRRMWHQQGVPVETVSPTQLADIEPNLQPQSEVDLVRDEAQLRNPRHLRALVAACEQRGVKLSSQVAALGFVTAAKSVVAVQTNIGLIEADKVCICGGAWSAPIASLLGFEVGVKPIRGQIVLLNPGREVIRHNINDGPRYLVPRDDGRVLVGSTEEDVGFEKRTTDVAIRGLLDFATTLVPALAGAPVEKSWSGLRPATLDVLPYLSRLPKFDNAWIAAGHFRAGLSMSCSTAVVMAQLINGEPPQIDLTPFRVDR